MSAVIDSTRDLSQDLLASVLLSALWAIPMLVIGTHGEFPLNDDWAYAKTTQVFLETGRFVRDAWTFAPIVTHVGLGALFATLFGFSFETLRLSGLFMGWVGLLASFWFFRQVGSGRATSLLGALVVGFNPIYLNLSYTFMTDVPFTALAIGSLLLLARGLADRRWPALAGGLCLAVGASLSRQPGVAIAIALFVAVGVSHRAWLRRRWLPVAGLAGLAVAAAALLLASGAAPGSYSLEMASDVPGLARRVGENAFGAFAYLGLFLSPLVALALASNARLGRGFAIAGAASAVALLVLTLLDLRMPVGANVLYDLGLGPPTLHGAQALPGAPPWVWWILTAIAMGGGMFGAALIARETWTHHLARRPERILLLAFPLVYLVPLFAVPNFFDRYLLPVLAPLAAVLLTPHDRPLRPSRAAHALGFALVVPLALFGVLGTRDYLEHNRARWALLEPLIERGVRGDNIDAGFEVDGWSGLHPAVVWQKRQQELDRDAHFLVSHLGPRNLPGYRLVETRSYQRLLPPREEVIGLYERDDPRAKPR